MKQYELTYLASPELSEEELKSLQDKLAAFVQAKGGTVTESQKAYKKRLAYPVQKKDVAYVCSMMLNLEAADLEALKKNLKEEPSVLRSLILNYKPVVEKPRRLRSKERQQLEEDAAKAEEQKEKPARKEKPKAELNEIEEKLEEILHDEKA